EGAGRVEGDRRERNFFSDHQRKSASLVREGAPILQSSSFSSSSRSRSLIVNTLTEVCLSKDTCAKGTDPANYTLCQSLFGMGADHSSVSSAQRAAIRHPQNQEDCRTGSLQSLRREKRQFADPPRLDRPSRAVCGGRSD